MYTLDFTVNDWHEGLVANLDNPKIYGVNRENLSDQIRIYLDLEENASYTLDFKSAGSKWFRLMAKGDGYLFYTLQAEDMKRRSFNIQLVATYADGQVKKTPIYKGYDILASINATDSANDKDASSFKEALMELAKWTKGEKGDKGDKGEKGEKGDKGDTPVKGVDYFTDAEVAEIEEKAKADVDALVTAVDKRVDVLTQELTAEGESRKKADEILENSISGEKTQRTNMDAAILENLATETTNREKADESINAAIATEVQNRITADADLLTKISEIPKFSIEVVDTLPTTDISDTTVYLVKTSETESGNLYTEYIHVNGAWEKLGTQTVDLSDYYQKEETDSLLAKKAEKMHSHVVADISDYVPYDDTEVRGLISAESEARTEADAKKVGYQEVQGNTLYMYADDSKAVLLATLELPTAPVQDVQVAGTSIVANGVANVPIASSDKTGVISTGLFNLKTSGTGYLYVSARSLSDYNNVLGNSDAISKGTLENIKQKYVDDILCSTDESQALTTQQKINARNRIGVQHEQLIETIVVDDETTAEISRYAEPNGTPYEFAELYVRWSIPAANATSNVGTQFVFAESGTVSQTIDSAISTSARYSGVYWDGVKYGRYINGTTDGYVYKGLFVNYPFNTVDNDLVNGFVVKTASTGVYFPKGTTIYIYGIRA